jgi:regulatory protein
VVLAAALRFLEVRARSVDEVRRRLARAGYPAGQVDAAVTRLLELGVLDDPAFARAWVASRDRTHPRGERALRDELRRKGISPDVITAVLAERSDPDGASRTEAMAPTSPGAAVGETGDSRAADRLLRRKEGALLRLQDPRRRRERAWAMLARAGFDSDTARAAVLAAEQRWGAGPPDDQLGL